MSDGVDLDIDFDDMDFDDMSMGPVEPTDDRTVAGKVVGSGFDGVVSALDPHLVASRIRGVLPEGMGAATDTAGELLDTAERAKDNLINPIRKEIPALKRQLHRMGPLVEKYAGKNIAEKFANLTKTGDVRSAGEDPAVVEMRNGIAGVFGAWREEQASGEGQQMALDMIKNKTEEERFTMNLRLMGDLLIEAKQANAYSQKVDISWKERMLELEYKQFHALSSLLKVSTEGTNASLSELKLISKNTSLPDLLKQKSNEAFKKQFADKWRGSAIDGIQTKGKQFFKKFQTNVMNKGAETGAKVADAMKQASDMISMVAGMQEQEREMAESMGGGGEPAQGSIAEIALNQAASGLGASVINDLIEKITKKATESKKGMELNDFGAYLANNKESLLTDILADMSTKEGMSGTVGKFFQEMLPTSGNNLEHLKVNAFGQSREAVQLDESMRTAQVVTVPGWLAKIHYKLAQLVDGDNAVEESFDQNKGIFVTRASAVKGTLTSVATKAQQEAFRGSINKFKTDILGESEGTLTANQSELLSEYLGHAAINKAEFRPSDITKAGNYSGLKSYNEDDAKVIASLIKDSIGSGDSRVNRHDIGSKRINKRNKLSTGYRALAAGAPLKQDMFNEFGNEGNNQLLIDAGLATLDDDGNMVLDHTALLSHRMGNGEFKTHTSAKMKGGTGGGNGGNNSLTPEYLERLTEIATATTGTDISTGEIKERLSDMSMLLGSIDDNRTDYSISPVMLSKDITESIIRMGSTKTPDAISTSLNTLSRSMDDIGIGHDPDVFFKLTELRDNTDTINNTLGTLVLQGNKRAAMAAAEIEDPTVIDNTTLAVQESNNILTGMLHLLGEMHNSNTIFFDFMTAQKSDVRSAGAILASGISKTFHATKRYLAAGINGALYIPKKVISALKSPGRVVSSFLNGFKNKAKILMGAGSDIYVVGDDKPRLTASDIIRGRYVTKKTKRGKTKVTVIKSIRDIHSAVYDTETGNVVITRDEINTKGLIAKNKRGIWEKFGELIPSGIVNSFGIGFKVASTVTGWGVSLATKAANLAGKLGTALSRKREMVDAYCRDENGRLKLIASVMDIQAGRIYVDIDGVKTQVKSLKDLSKGAVYKMNATTGELELVATKDMILSGLRTAADKKLKYAKGVLGTIANLGKFGLDVVAGAVTLPFKIIGMGYDRLKRALTAKALKSLFLNLPDNIVLNANTVYLMTSSLKGPHGRGTGGTPLNKRGGFAAWSRGLAGNNGIGHTDETPVHIRESLRDKWNRHMHSGTDSDDSMYSGEHPAKKSWRGRIADNKKKLTGSIRSRLGKRQRMAALGATMLEMSHDGLADEDSDTPGLTAHTSLKERISSRKDALMSSMLGLMAVEKKGGFGAWSTGTTTKAEKDAKSWKTKFNKLKKTIADKHMKGDVDGDGDRDGSWRDQLARKKAKLTGALGKGFGKLGKKRRMAALGATMLAMSHGNGKPGGPGDPNQDPDDDSSITEDLEQGYFGAKAVAALGTAYTVSKGFIAKQVSRQAARVALASSAEFLAAGAVAAAPVVLVGAVVAAVCLASSAAVDYLARHSDIHKIEGSRFLAYGYSTGNEGVLDEVKVNLRYFEGKILKLLQHTDKGVVLSKSPEAIYEDYYEMFGGKHTQAGRAEFIAWFTNRFLPVLFKWLRVTAAFGERADKAAKPKGPKKKLPGASLYGGGYVAEHSSSPGAYNQAAKAKQYHRQFTLQALDTLVHKDEMRDFLNATVNFGELNWDPLNVMRTASFNMPLNANREVVLAYNAKLTTGVKSINIVINASISEHKKLGPKASVTNLSTYRKDNAVPKVTDRAYNSDVSAMNNTMKYSGNSYGDMVGGGIKRSSFKPVTETDKRIAQYDALIEASASKYNVDPMLIRAIIKQESGGHADAVSHVGAGGLMQLMPATARDLGVTDIFDPAQNIAGGTKYIASLIKRFKDPALALMAYNMGGGNLNANIRRAGSRDPDDIINHLHSFTDAVGKTKHESIGYVNNIARNYLGYSGRVLSQDLQAGPGGTLLAMKHRDTGAGIRSRTVALEHSGTRNNVNGVPAPAPTTTNHAQLHNHITVENKESHKHIKDVTAAVRESTSGTAKDTAKTHALLQELIDKTKGQTVAKVPARREEIDIHNTASNYSRAM